MRAESYGASRIHEFSTSFLLTTFLPYHTLPVFVTLLSILPPQIPDEYRFLQPYIRSLQSPPRAAIVLQAINQPRFLTAVSEYTLESCRARQHYQTLISFWGGLLTEAVNGLVDKNRSGRKAVQQDNDQGLLHLLGPIFSDALMMKKVPQAQIAAYMALSVFVSKGDLGDAAVSAFMEQLALGWTSESARPGLVCLSILGQHRSAKQVSGKIAKALLKIPDVERHLVEIGREWSVDRLANGLCLAMIDRAQRRGCPKGLPLVAALLRANILMPKQTSVLFKALLLIGTNLNTEADKTGSVRKELGTLLVQLSQEPGECGDIIQEAITDVDFDMEALEMRLDLSLRPTKLLAPAEEEDAMDTETTAEPQKEALSETMARLGQLSDGLAADLGKDAGSAFEEVSQAFLQAIVDDASEQRLQELDTLPVLAREQASTNPTYFSFFVRIWCGPYPALAKSTALDIAKNTLKSCEKNLDYQGLLPYVITALGEPSKKVRQAAADFMAVLASLYPTKTKGATMAVWAEKKLYPKSQSWDLLSTEAIVKSLQSVILPNLEECVMHQDHIISMLESSIGNKSKNEDADDKSRLSQSTRLSLFRMLSSSVLRTPFLLVKGRLLRALTRVRSVGSTNRTQLLLPALTWWANLTAEEGSELCRQERVDKTEVNQRFADIVIANDATGLQELVKIVNKENDTREEFIDAVFQRLQKAWSSMKPENKTSIATQMLDLALSESPADEAPKASSIEAAELLRSVNLTTEILAQFLESIRMDPVSSPPNKRRRVSGEANRGAPVHGGPEVAMALKKATFILQLVEASDPEAHADLLPALFATLAKLQAFRATVGSDLGYLQNVVLTSLLGMLPVYKANRELKITTSDGYGDLLVNCIQKSSSPIVQNAALLLIARLATTAPDVVIHCVMPIFTFMGVSVVRQSDDYSAHVVNQVIKEVVPPLLETLRKGKKNVVSSASELLLSFTSSYEHIPSHRRFGIFMSLIETLGADEFLFAVIALLVEKQGPTDGVLAFVTELLDRHNVKSQLEAVLKHVRLVGDLFKPPPNLASALLRPANSKLDPQAAEQAALSQLSALPALLSSRRLKVQIRKLTEQDDMQAGEVRELYAGLLESVLSLAETVKSNKELYALCGESLANLLNLLTIGEFIKAVENLLDRPDLGLRQKVLKALDTRVNVESSTDMSSRNVLLGFLPQLTAAIRDSDDIRYKHTAIACVDKIAEKYGEKDLEGVAAAASIIAGEHCLGQSDKQLRVMALLCLASLVGVLGPAVIPVLPSAFSYTAKYLNESLAGKEPDTQLHNACYYFVLTVAQHMPEMISGAYLEQVLNISSASAEGGLDAESDESRRSCLKCLATRLDAKTMFTGLAHCWPVAAGAGFTVSLPPHLVQGCRRGANTSQATGEYVSLIRTAIGAHRETTIRKNITPLSNVFLSAFDFRRQEFEKGPVNSAAASRITEVEGSVNEVALRMVHKLNDATFRPIFSHLVEWTTSLPASDAQGRNRRSQSVYSFLLAFFSQLGRIVTSYSTYVTDDAVRILQAADPADTEERKLWETVLNVLARSFEHDEDGFWQSPAHFEAVRPVLVSQFRHAAAADLASSLVPAVVELARASNSQPHQKALNTAILKLLRDSDARVRLAAVKCQQALTERLGEEWLAMLPEMLPYVSELQDDDDEDVERETHRWIVGVEGVLGESLDSMLQ